MKGNINKMGAESGTRTRDLLITNELLYQLSYFGLIFCFEQYKITFYILISKFK